MIIDFSRKSFYERVGGEAGLRRLVNVFYDIIEEERHPDAALLHRLFMMGKGMPNKRSKQFAFLSGLFGGPQLYLEEFGHTDVERIHQHVTITPEARDAWLNCMSMAMGEVGLNPRTKTVLMTRFTEIANFLVGQTQVGECSRKVSN